MDLSPGSPLKKAIEIGNDVKSHFDWPSSKGVFEKVREEFAELEETLGQSKGLQFDEMGDVLFTLVQLCRHLSVNPEKAIDFANQKHSLRYNRMVEIIKEKGLMPEDLKLEALENYWQLAKKDTKPQLDVLLASFEPWD